MLICFGISISKYINHFNPGGSKFMEILMIRYLYPSVDLYVPYIMLEGLILHSML